MPENQEHRTRPQQRVRIKGDLTHMYEHARAFNEGTVRRQLHDEFGYPLILVEWDKEHWAYSGQPDGLYLEAHFDPVEEKMADKQEDFLAAIANLVEQFQNQNEGEEKPDPRPTKEPKYKDILEKAVEAAEEGEAFLIFVVTPDESLDKGIMFPAIFADSKSDAAALALDATAADYVASSVLRLVQHRIVEGHGDPKP
jgi:hypothetical protein